MDNTINNAIDETRTLSDKAREIALDVVLKVGVPDVDPLTMAALIINGIVENGGKELALEAFVAGKQASYNIIANTSPKTTPVKAPKNLNHVEIQRVNIQTELWEKQVFDVSQAMLNDVDTWLLSQKVDGRSKEEIEKTFDEDVASVSETSGLPNGRVTGSYRSRYVQNYEDYILNLEREGQMFGFSGLGVR